MTKIVDLPVVLRSAPGILGNGMPLHSFILANGMRVLLVVSRTAPVFTFQTWVMAGSATEKCDPKLNRTGLAHLFEHLMFRGTDEYPDGEFDEALTRAGGVDLNASTWYDRTNYYVNLPSEKLDVVLELEADRFENLSLSREILETERGAVIGEFELGQDDPETVLYDKLYETAFQAHPYRWSTIGSREDIESFTLEQARYFYSRYYTPENTVLIAAGDLDPEEFIAKVSQAYGGIRKKPRPLYGTPAEPEQRGERRASLVHSHLECERLVAAYRSPPPTSRDFPALWIAQAILSEGKIAVLNRRWVESGLASSASGDIDQFRDWGLLAFDAELQPGARSADLLRILDEAVRELACDPGRVAEDLERARNQLLLRGYEEWEDLSGVAGFMGESLAATGDPLFGFTLLERLRTVTADEVVSVLGRYAVPERRTILIARPEE